MKSAKKTVASPSANHCFGCGPANEHGLKLKFALDHAAGTSAATVKLARRFEGPPGYAHGGIIATLLDEAMGKVNRIHDVVAMTRNMEVDYLRPCPLGEPLTVTGQFLRRDGRKIFMQAEIHNAAGKLLVQGKGIFIVIDPAALFAKHSRARVDAACPVATYAPKPRTVPKSRTR
jgi:uncharacterized protein (TIGR00369 family)